MRARWRPPEAGRLAHPSTAERGQIERVRRLWEGASHPEGEWDPRARGPWQRSRGVLGVMGAGRWEQQPHQARPVHGCNEPVHQRMRGKRQDATRAPRSPRHRALPAHTPRVPTSPPRNLPRWHGGRPWRRGSWHILGQVAANRPTSGNRPHREGGDVQRGVLRQGWRAGQEIGEALHGHPDLALDGSKWPVQTSGNLPLRKTLEVDQVQQVGLIGGKMG